MSNNSYLFAVEPLADHTGSQRHRLVAQQAYDSPLLFLLLCSVSPTQVPTRVFPNESGTESIAILADFAAGLARANEFMQACLNLNQQHQVIPPAELEEMVAQVRNILHHPDLARCTHLLLEAGEILFMVCADGNQAARRLLIQAQQSPARATERLRTIFLEQYTPPTSEDTNDDGFYIPDFDRMSDAEYFEFIREDFEDADALRPPPEKLENLGFRAFNSPAHLDDFDYKS